MTSDFTVPLPAKIFKVAYATLRPFLLLAAATGGLLSLFEPLEGSNSRVIAIVVFAASVVLLVAGSLIERSLVRSSDQYRIWRPRVVTAMDLKNLVPLVAITLITLLPFYLIVVTSIKNSPEANNVRFTWWPQQGVTTQAYSKLFSFSDVTQISIWRSVFNSFAYALLPTLAGVLASALSAYAFAKLQFKGNRVMYRMLIWTMLMPGCVTMATSYLMFDLYGWTNTPLPLVIPGLFGGAGTVMFLREFFMGIPNGLLEAAWIDGAGKWKAFSHIMLPLARPALLAQFILGFIGAFNAYMGPLIYLNSPDLYTIQVAIDFLNTSQPDASVISAASIFALVPMLLLYVIFQKQILSGISMSSGLKG